MFNKPKLQTLIECMVFYLEDCAALGQAERTISGKKYNLERFISWCLQNKVNLLNEISLHVLEAYRRYLKSYRQKNGKPINQSTLRNHLTAVKVFLYRMYYYEYIDENPAAKFLLPKNPSKLPSGFLSLSELDKLYEQTKLHGIKGLRDLAILNTYFATGIRRMELARICLSDIDMESNMLTINQGKGNKDRRIPIADSACHWIAEYLKNTRPQIARLRSGDTLFLTDDGLQFNESQLSYLVTKYIKRAGLKKSGSCNLLRHSAATLMLENGADIRHIQKMLGHASISTTQIYTHVSPNQLKEVYEKTHPSALVSS